jgi:hypothetical protein
MQAVASQPLHRLTDKPLAVLAPWDRSGGAEEAAVATVRPAPDGDAALVDHVPRPPAPGWVTGSAARVSEPNGGRVSGWARVRPAAQ